MVCLIGPHFDHVITELTQLLGLFSCGLSYIMHSFSFMVRVILHAIGKMGDKPIVKTPMKFVHSSRAGDLAIHQKVFERSTIQQTFALISGMRNVRGGGGSGGCVIIAS